jgi:hypothetical protein
MRLSAVPDRLVALTVGRVLGMVAFAVLRIEHVAQEHSVRFVPSNHSSWTHYCSAQRKRVRNMFLQFRNFTFASASLSAGSSLHMQFVRQIKARIAHFATKKRHSHWSVLNVQHSWQLIIAKPDHCLNIFPQSTHRYWYSYIQIDSY